MELIMETSLDVKSPLAKKVTNILKQCEEKDVHGTPNREVDDFLRDEMETLIIGEERRIKEKTRFVIDFLRELSRLEDFGYLVGDVNPTQRPLLNLKECTVYTPFCLSKDHNIYLTIEKIEDDFIITDKGAIYKNHEYKIDTKFDGNSEAYSEYISTNFCNDSSIDFDGQDFTIPFSQGNFWKFIQFLLSFDKKLSILLQRMKTRRDV